MQQETDIVSVKSSSSLENRFPPVSPLAAQFSTPQTSGLIVGWVNTVNMLGFTFFQYLVGHFLDKYWSGTVNTNGLRLYAARDYELALGILLNTVILALLIASLMRSRNIKIK